MKQAKGKRFAISRFGSLTDFLTRATLRHFGVDAKDVTILQIGSTPARFAALTREGRRCFHRLVPGDRDRQSPGLQ